MRLTLSSGAALAASFALLTSACGDGNDTAEDPESGTSTSPSSSAQPSEEPEQVTFVDFGEEPVLKPRYRKAALAARLAAQSSSSSSSSSSSFSMAVPARIAASGDVVRPLASFNNFGTPYAGHKGTDYMVGRGAPIYSIADGVVVASSENGPGWGVYVKVAHNIGGKSVTSLYAHMSYGTRRVSVGQTVSAGQLIGQVGDTGRAFGTHLHLEIRLNGGYVNAESWLKANVG